MTNEDYKKKYEDANKRVATRFGSNVARELFPDLYESEDERIRKDVISFVKQAINARYGIISKEREEKWIAWLEKQGEKLPVGFYYVNSEGKKFYSDTFKCGDFTFHVEKQSEQIPANSAKTCKDEQKPTWSEEDETVLNNLIYALANDIIGNCREEYVDWLKSLKDRIK